MDIIVKIVRHCCIQIYILHFLADCIVCFLLKSFLFTYILTHIPVYEHYMYQLSIFTYNGIVSSGSSK